MTAATTTTTTVTRQNNVTGDDNVDGSRQKTECIKKRERRKEPKCFLYAVPFQGKGKQRYSVVALFSKCRNNINRQGKEISCCFYYCLMVDCTLASYCHTK